ncbi:2'-5' RNA ligase [Alteribacillus persepolensis]|uniref:RNA 2',3'-cyclic phosphodiesterase n=1 Tax=Alteribacillus persepolensis TaxID=568899 RepID=A0A1G8E435_9BACI|nr:RNA 2',3'-cyclic phosphodiesterase [Alteribacillus persepolensis]SDH64615.1 2'-5' RNA ligase [Alteribacillus persepolensis]
MSPHYFIALPLPTQPAERVHSWKKQVEQDFPFKKWVHPNDYHVTLFFLGAADSTKLQRVCAYMDEVAQEVTTFSLQTTQAGWFGKTSSPRILWAGVSGSDVLYDLQKQVADRCEKAGFAVEKRPYKPHITVARTWQGKHSFQDAAKALPILPSSSWEAKEFVLYQTHLGRQPKYERLETFLL